MRILEIDGLRAIAAMAVIGVHYSANLVGTYNLNPAYEFWIGHFGVQIFFIISGIVITISAHRARSATRFCMARAKRLYPAYWFSLIFAYVLVITTGLIPSRDVGKLYPLINVTMFQQTIGVIHYIPVYWTLYVELQFYLLLAALLYFKGKQHFCDAMAAATCIGIAMTALPTALNAQITYISPLFKFAHLFLIGMLLSPINRSMSPKNLTYTCIALTGCIANGLKYTVIIAIITLIFELALKQKLYGLKSRPLVYLGQISYSLYLLHMPIGIATYQWCYHNKISPITATMMAICIAFGLSAFSAHYIERVGTDRFLKPIH